MPEPDQRSQDAKPAGTKAAPLPGYHFQQQGRSLPLLLALLFWGLALGYLSLTLEASRWIVLLFALPTLPAIWDLWRNPTSGLAIDADQIAWFTATARDRLALSDLALLRLDRRWDFSFRATLITTRGGKIRLPQSCLPPVDRFELELQVRGITSQRHHFTAF